MNKATLYLLALTITMLLNSPSQAVLIASDSFSISPFGIDYVPGTSIVGQNPTVGARGFDGAWGNPPLDIFLPTAGGLTHPMSPGAKFDGQLVVNGTQGNAGFYGARNLSRAIDYTPTDGTYYSSVLLRKNSATDRADLLAGLGRSQDADTSIVGVDGTWIGFVDGGISFFWDSANLRTLLPAAQTNVSETYLALLEYDFSTSGPDAVTATIYNGASQEVASDQFTGLNLDQTMGRFSVLTQDYGPIPIVDEWRFGTTRSDVAGGLGSLFYKFISREDGEHLATLELASLPATHEQVRGLIFTPEGANRFLFPIINNNNVYPGTFDTSRGAFCDDGVGGLVGGPDFFEQAYILDGGLGFAFAADTWGEDDGWMGSYDKFGSFVGCDGELCEYGTWEYERGTPPTPTPDPTGGLLVNAGFESAGQGWTDFFADSAVSITYRGGTADPHEGSLALKLTSEQFDGAPNESGVYQDIPVTPNTMYEYSGYLRNGDGGDFASGFLIGDVEAFLKIIWLDTDLSEIFSLENNVPPQGLTAATAQDNAWLFNELLVQSPPDAAFARIMAVYNVPNGSFHVGEAWFDTLDFRVAIPEPSTLLLAALGLLALSVGRKRP